MTTTMEAQMSEQKVTSIRINVESVEAAKIAAAFKGISIAEYVSALVLDHANRDIEEGYKTRGQPKPKKGK